MLALTGLALAVIFASAALFSGLGTRWNIWHFRTGLSVLRYAAYGEAAVVLISLSVCVIAAYKRVWNVFAVSLTGLLIGAAVFSVPFNWGRTAKSVPPIHDITTDTEDPPQFSAVLALRKDALNPAEYGGQEISVLQRAAYPDIRPVLLDVPTEQVFELSLKTARKMGWDIVNADKDKGLIEATDTTFWFGFKDDIVIRISQEIRGSRIDLRSVSRAGKSDVGTNARRIRNFVKELEKEAVKP
ncbi:MAG: DUF1499 domain-containing protein [Nitrospirae bacterium]|nr:DUF1499 domain-containing protein [Nitrospirota bacterium]